MVETSEVRKRLLRALADARAAAAARRAAAGQAADEFGRFLTSTAVPVFQQVAQILRAEGLPFELATPRDHVALVPERAREDYLEIALDSTADPPAAVGRVRHTHGRRVLQIERPLRPGAAMAELTDEDVLAFVLAEIGRFAER